MNRGLLMCVAMIVVMTGVVRGADEMKTVSIEIRADVRHQTIDHFTASDCWSLQKIGVEWSAQNREKIADLLFSMDNGIGLSMWRFNIGGGINHETIRDPFRTAETFEVSEGKYDWTRQPGERWFLAAAKARGVGKFLAFVNSPPGRMTRSGLTNAGLAGGGHINDSTNLKPEMEAQYARYLADILAHFRDNPNLPERINFDWVSPINEPQVDWNSGQEGNRAGNDDIKRVVRVLRPALDEQKLSTRILIPESNAIQNMLEQHKDTSKRYGTAFGDYINAFAGDESLRPLIPPVLCYHGYGSDGKELIPLRQKVRERMNEHPGWSVWQSEYCVLQHKRDLGMDTALMVARVIHSDLAIAGASAWAWWLAVSPYDYKDGLIFTDWKKPGDPQNVLPSKLLWAMGNFSRYVRPAWSASMFRRRLTICTN